MDLSEACQVVLSALDCDPNILVFGHVFSAKNSIVSEKDFAEFRKFVVYLKKSGVLEIKFSAILKQMYEQYKTEVKPRLEEEEQEDSGCNGSTDEEEEDSDSSTDEEDEEDLEFEIVDAWDYKGKTYLTARNTNDKNEIIVYDFVSQERLGIVENYKQENQKIIFDSRGK